MSASRAVLGRAAENRGFRRFGATAPRAFMPGTKMAFAGIKVEQRITGLIAYLKQFDVSGAQVPTPK